MRNHFVTQQIEALFLRHGDLISARGRQRLSSNLHEESVAASVAGCISALEFGAAMGVVDATTVVPDFSSPRWLKTVLSHAGGYTLFVSHFMTRVSGQQILIKRVTRRSSTRARKPESSTHALFSYWWELEAQRRANRGEERQVLVDRSLDYIHLSNESRFSLLQFYTRAFGLVSAVDRIDSQTGTALSGMLIPTRREREIANHVLAGLRAEALSTRGSSEDRVLARMTLTKLRELIGRAEDAAGKRDEPPSGPSGSGGAIGEALKRGQNRKPPDLMNS